MLLRVFRSDEVGRFGTLEIDNHVFFTVEKPWKDNTPFKSCVPTGEYALVPHGEYGKDGDVLALVGETVSHYEDPNFKRYACLIHTANYPKDVVGCIGLGDGYNPALGMVTNSRKSISKFYDIVSPYETHNLTIEKASYVK